MPRCRLPSLKLLSVAIVAMLPVLSAFAGPQSKRPNREIGNGSTEQTQNFGRQPRDGSLSDAVRQVERDTRGEVLSAERVQYDGRDMHRVKVVDDQGRVRVFMQDPNPKQDSAGHGHGRGNRGASGQATTPTRDTDD
jgi:hypothetical protein